MAFSLNGSSSPNTSRPSSKDLKTVFRRVVSGGETFLTVPAGKKIVLQTVALYWGSSTNAYMQIQEGTSTMRFFGSLYDGIVANNLQIPLEAGAIITVANANNTYYLISYYEEDV